MRKLIAVTSVLMVLAVPSWADTEKAIVALPAENFGFLPFYVAQEKHFFEDQGLTVQKVVLPGVGTTNGVISGAVNFGFSNGASLTRAAARGQKLLAIALMSDKPVWSIMLRKEVAEAAHFDPKAPLAERAKALTKAHGLAIDTVNSVGHGLMRVVEKMGGIDPESIQTTPLLSSDAISAFTRGAIDGFVANPPWTEQILITGTAVEIVSSLDGDPPWLTPFGSGVVVTQPQFCADHRSICMKMGHALVVAMTYVHEHQAESLAVMREHFPQMDAKVAERSFAVIEKSMPKTPIVVEEAISNSDRLNVEAGFMKPDEKLTSYKELFTDEFVR